MTEEVMKDVCVYECVSVCVCACVWEGEGDGGKAVSLITQGLG